MTREEVAEIMTYCQEHTVSHKDRLAELGIAPWRFYDANPDMLNNKHKPNLAAESSCNWFLVGHLFQCQLCINNLPQAKVQEVRCQNSNDEH